MGVVSRATLKTYFETGDQPTEAQFVDLIDSFVSKDAESFVGSVSNISSLTNVDTVALSDNDLIVLLGFYNAGDGGKGSYYWDSSEPHSNHNGGTIINPSHLSTAGTSGWYSSTGDGTNDSGNGCWKHVNQSKLIPIQTFGVIGDGSDRATELQGLFDYGFVGYSLQNDTVTIESTVNITVNGSGLSGLADKLVIDSNSSIKFFDVSAEDVRFNRVEIDGNSVNRTTGDTAIVVNSGSHRFEFHRSGIINLYSDDLFQLYGLRIDLDQVHDFKVTNSYFNNISTQNNDFAQPEGGFSGGILLENIQGLGTISDSDASYGKIDNCDFYKIWTHFPSGTSQDDKDLNQDGDAIRTFAGNAEPMRSNVTVTDCNFRSVQKRCVKVSGTYGIIVDGVFCDATQSDIPSDSQTYMVSVVKGYGDTKLRNVRCFANTRQMDTLFQVTESDGAELSNIEVDNCIKIVSTIDTILGDSTISVNNIRATTHGGASFEDCKTVEVSNAVFRYDRSDFPATGNATGIGFFISAEVENLKLDNIKISGSAQFFISNPAGQYSLSDIEYVWDDTTSPATTTNGDELVKIYGNGQFDNLSFKFPDGMPNYLADDRGIVRIWQNSDDNAISRGENLTIISKNNAPLDIERTSRFTLNRLTVSTDREIPIGSSVYDCKNIYINDVSFYGTGIIRLYRTLENIFIRNIKAPEQRTVSLFNTNNPSYTNVYISDVYWNPSGTDQVFNGLSGFLDSVKVSNVIEL